MTGMADKYDFVLSPPPALPSLIYPRPPVLASLCQSCLPQISAINCQSCLTKIPVTGALSVMSTTVRGRIVYHRYLSQAFCQSCLPQIPVAGFLSVLSTTDTCQRHSVSPLDHSYLSQAFPPKGGQGCLMSPPCLESQGCHLIPLCYLLSCSSA